MGGSPPFRTCAQSKLFQLVLTGTEIRSGRKERAKSSPEAITKAKNGATHEKNGATQLWIEPKAGLSDSSAYSKNFRESCLDSDIFRLGKLGGTINILRRTSCPFAPRTLSSPGTTSFALLLPLAGMALVFAAMIPALFAQIL